MLHRYALLLLPCCVAPAALAQGDLCVDAWLIEPGPQVADGPFTGEGATHDNALNADWYAFDPPAAGYITVSSCGAVHDTRVFVHTGSCGSLTELGGNDDGCPEGYPPGSSLLANVPVSPGNLYLIEWDDRYSAQGFDWMLYFHTCPVAIPDFTIGDHTIDLTWDGALPGSAYEVEYGPVGFLPGTGESMAGIVGTDGPPVHIEGLLSATRYDVYIRIACGPAGTSPFEGPWHPVTTGALPNDDCGGAFPISCGALVEGSTELAAADDVADCGTGIAAVGVWYTFTGVSGNVLLSTCGANGYDTRLNVFSGPCDDLQCVDGNDDGQFCGYGSEVAFVAEAERTYQVLVQGYDEETGDFGLSMTCPGCAAPMDIAVTPGDQQALVQWSSANVGATFTVEYGPLGFAPGNGTEVNGTVGADGPPVYIEGLTPSTSYDVYVSEDCGAAGTSTLRGPVEFTTGAGPLPPNAFCGGALPIACGGEVTGDTQEGFIAIGADCAGNEVTSKGLWYTFIGQGVEVTLSTCGQAGFDTRISVFTGTCAALTCVGMNDDAPGCVGNSSRFTFVAMDGVTYRVLVHGYEEEAGLFTLDMACVEPCDPAVPNDGCNGAIALVPQPLAACEPLAGTLACAYASSAPAPSCDPFVAALDVWYRFNTGPGVVHRITADAVTAGGLQMALYEGCDTYVEIACSESVDDPLTLAGLEPNTDYYIRLWVNSADDAGTFTLCDQAELLTGVPEMSSGTVDLWPVPARGRVNFSGVPAGARALELVDGQGRVVRTQTLNGAVAGTFDLGDSAAGVYVLRANGGSGWAGRVLVER